jgi:hypothetical protein
MEINTLYFLLFGIKIHVVVKYINTIWYKKKNKWSRRLGINKGQSYATLFVKTLNIRRLIRKLLKLQTKNFKTS